MEQVHLSVCMSLDGHIDALGRQSLMLSSDEDRQDMHALRAQCDAILVGAGTARRDTPRLTVRCEDALRQRRAEGRPDHPAKIVVTRTGALDPASGFFTNGGAPIVLCPGTVWAQTQERLGPVAQIIALDSTEPAAILSELARQGIRRLLVEGGTQVLTQFLAAGAFHHLRMAIAPFLVGQDAAPRLAGPGCFPHGPDNRLLIRSTRLLGNVCVMDMHNPDPRLSPTAGQMG